jgi:hypothetical protein
MKNHVPLDRRQFFQFLKVWATNPGIFNGSHMMRIDQLPSFDRSIVETFKPSWRPGAQVEVSETDVCIGKQAWAIEPDERAFLTGIDGQHTIAAILGGREDAQGLYERCIRLLTILLEAAVLDLEPPA